MIIVIGILVNNKKNYIINILYMKKENNEKVYKKTIRILTVRNKFLFFLILFIIYYLISKLLYKFERKEKKYNIKNLTQNCKRKNNFKKLTSNKWIVITTINSPSSLIFKLLNKLYDWKIVVVGDIKTKDENWKIFKFSDKLVYLSIEEQLNLCYYVTKYIPLNSYSRKNIGYLYAIENGAKEIFEIDDNINITNLLELNQIYNEINYNRISFVKSNFTQMVNPYYYFGLRNIWPRGFKLKDIGKDNTNQFINIASKQLNLKPLIFQGLINGEPDLDSIFLQTRIQKNSKINLNFSFNYPLIYLPGNYIPINSKNTKYLYEAFPALPLLTTVNEKVSDIWRGYIMQKYIWGYKGVVLFYLSSSYKERKNNANDSDFFMENQLYYKLEEFLSYLNKEINNDKFNPSNNLINIIESLVNFKILEKQDLKMYKAFIQDLSNIGYNYNSGYNNKIYQKKDKFLNINSEFIIETPFQNKIVLNNNYNQNRLKILFHILSNKKYDDILLVINYNYSFLLKLNNYMYKLYSKAFPHILFISPKKITFQNNNIISCPKSFKGYYAYICFKKIFYKYPKMKGYLIINDDNFLKYWNLENYDFNIPWFNMFTISRCLKWHIFKNSYKNLDNIFHTNLEWRNNIIKFIGCYNIPKSLVDNIYIPNSIFYKFIKIVEQMYKKRIFLELAIPSALGIIGFPKYLLTSHLAIWNENRKNIIKYLKYYFDKTFIHPIKFLNNYYQKEVNSYIYFINAEYF